MTNGLLILLEVSVFFREYAYFNSNLKGEVKGNEKNMFGKIEETILGQGGRMTLVRVTSSQSLPAFHNFPPFSISYIESPSFFHTDSQH